MSSATLLRTDSEIATPFAEPRRPIAVGTSVGTVHLRLTSDLQSVETIWKKLQEISPCTGAQTFDWAKAWARNVLEPEGARPAIVLGTGPDGSILFLWAFETGRRAGLSVLRWLGGEHANYNMGLFAPGIAAALTAEDMSRLLAKVGRQTGAAAALLEAQPFSFDGVHNPFAKLLHRRSPNAGYAAKLGDFTTLYHQRFGKRSRSGLDRKERKLAELGRLRYGWAETREERLTLIETFFDQKAEQFAAMGVKNIFDAQARAFYRELVLLEEDNPSRLRMGYIKLDDDVLATFSGTLGHKRLLIVLCSLASGETQRCSPGALLIRHQIEEACEQGLSFYDFGAGAGSHKEQWSDVVLPLFDNAIVFKPQGLLLTLPLGAISSLKRAIKSNPRLWSIAQSVRSRLFGSTDAL
ncbi:MAG TPA: GNAT family N-acetyltransferase [Methyloceanibacter sp.]|nr:GNAT family N-acetyltransferase [Methyloceanibacter sp.]